MGSAEPNESFRDLLLRYRGRTGLTQRELADRVGINRRSLQEWEVGVSYPSIERLESLLRVLFQAQAFTPGREAAEIEAIWSSITRESPRAHGRLDPAWLDRLLAEQTRPAAAPPSPPPPSPAASQHPLPMGEGWGEGGGRRQDWGDAPDATGLVGRADDLLTLSSWVLDERSRLVALLGMGGMGKTILAARLAREVAASFERVYWRSVRDAPAPGDWLTGAIGFLSDQQLVPPGAESERLAALLQVLRERRCLLVLDNFDSLFEPGQGEGGYREGLAGYGRALQAMGEGSHQSCLVLTSRETPRELALLGGDGVRTLPLRGLEADETQALLARKQLVGTREQWAELNARFGGNGLALKVVGERIRELFGGDLGAFLEDADAGKVFGGLRRLLVEQIERSSAAEREVLRLLAVEREPVSLRALLAGLGTRVDHGALLEALESLRRRSLVERADTVGPAAFTLPSVVLGYVADQLLADTVQ